MKNQNRVDALLAINPNKVSAPALKAALAERQRRDEQAQAEVLLVQLDTARRNTMTAVENLRRVRRQEKVTTALVANLNVAEEQFHANGDYVAYSDAVRDAHRKYEAGLAAK